MQPYVVRQGESLGTLAQRDGFDPDVVWNDPTNDDLRSKRTDPMVLAPSDIIYLPDPSAPANGTTLQTGAENAFTATPRPPLHARLILVDETGAPLAGQTVVVEGADPGAPPSKSEADGSVVIDFPYGQTSIRIQLPDAGLELVAQRAFLDPVTEPSGLEQRLSALGLLPTLPAIHDPDAAAIVAQEYQEAAIRAFQKKAGLPETGQIDDATQRALVDAHGA
jgi:hypothetical protein